MLVLEYFHIGLDTTLLLTLFGYFDPENVEKATLLSMIELGDLLEIDGHKLWQEFIVYKLVMHRYG